VLNRFLLAAAVAIAACNAQAANEKNIDLTVLGTYETNVFDEGAAEIVAHDPATQRLFVINANAKSVDILNIFDPTNPTSFGAIDVSASLPDAGGVNSVAVKNGIVAVAVENEDKQANGWAAFYDTDGNYLGQAPAGALPDAVTFTPNGAYALLANEGEPSDDYQVDPEGSVTIVDLRAGVAAATARQATFTDFNGMDPLPEGLRAPRPFGATLAQDLEPEYIATSFDSKTAWVSLQENNGVAVVDIPAATVTALVGLGSKDHSADGNGLDASDKDGEANIANWPVKGLYMPDSIFAYRSKGKTYLVTANEGDGREYGYEIDKGATEQDLADCEALIAQEDGFNAGEANLDGGELECVVYLDEIRVEDMDLDDSAFDDAETLQQKVNLGRLKAVGTEGDDDNDGYWEKIYSYGARSITIWDTAGNPVFDTGDIIEQKTQELLPDDFNSTNDENNSFDSRSDDKGPEPETAIVGKAFGRQYAFVGLERIGGIMIFDVTDPANTRYVNYVNNRDFLAENNEDDENLAGVDAGDLGPEGLFYIKAEDSPIGEPLLVVGNEISGSTTIYKVIQD